ncbi:MAG: HepT-like ribonuclease domain-containing protein [Chitinophagales bacterium]
MKEEYRSYIMYLEDIQVSMFRISEYISDLDFDGFSKDYKTIDAVVRNFEIIGKASKNLPESVKEKYDSIPWKEMY